MNGSTKLATPLVAALALAACSGGSFNVPAALPQSPAQTHALPQWQRDGSARQACPDVGPGYAQCMVLVESGIAPNVAGWAPTDLQTRYKLPIGKGEGQIVAIIDAFDNPNVASDLAKYRSHFGLGKGTFKKYTQRGETKGYPKANDGWALEIDLDAQMVSAVCPKCTIYLIEADSNHTHDLERAEAEAVKLKAHIVSNSWGCPGSNDCVDASQFAAPHVLYLAAAGDFGFGTQAPAALGNVVAVGGTVLFKTGSTYTESTWNGTGSGCATGVDKPGWQHDPICKARTMNDVSAVAANVALYDSFRYGGWIEVDGTSISTPIVAGAFALAGNASSRQAGRRFWTLSRDERRHDLHDITSGFNAYGCGSYLCAARPGYDAPTGWGTPNGIGAF